MAQKEHWWREESITADPKEEDPMTEDPKDNPFNKKVKEDPCYCQT